MIRIFLQIVWGFLFFLLVQGCQNRELNVTMGRVMALPDTINGNPVLSGPSVLLDSNRYVWGGSVVKGRDRMYHMFFSTWDGGSDSLKFTDSWVLNSEIGYAVSQYPDQGFHFKQIVLKGRRFEGDPGAWDAQVVHNPHIKHFNNKYYLYYVGSRDPGKPPAGSPGANLSKRNRVQQSQQVGVIEFDDFSDLLSGNFVRSVQPLLSPRTRIKKDNILNPSPSGTIPKPDNIVVVNPSVAQDKFVFDIKMPDGKIASAEDPYVWYNKRTRRFFAVVKDFSGRLTGEQPGLALLESNEGITWSRTMQSCFSRLEVVLQDGIPVKVTHLERPQLLLDDYGKPEVLYAACALGKLNDLFNGGTFNIQIPVEITFEQ